MKSCAFCGFNFTPHRANQKYCSQPCYKYAQLKRQEVTRNARNFMKRIDPKVARALALTTWPGLRTKEEQEALDKWLEERLTAGIIAWAKDKEV